MADSRIVTDTDLSPDSKPTVSRGARACTVCRTAKMKCVGAEDDGAKPCQRCRRSNLECIFEKHRRGRKPGSKLSEASKMLRKIEKGLNPTKVKSQDPAEISPQVPYPVSDSRSAHSRYSPREFYVPSQGPRSPNASPYPPPSVTHAQFPTLTAPYPPRFSESAQRPAAPSTSSPRSIEADDDDDDDDDDKDADSAIYPAKMVEREGRRHSFFGTILNNPGPNAVGGKPPPSNSNVKPQSPNPSLPLTRVESISIPRLPSTRLDDPVSAGLISESELPALFEMVFLRLNPFINLFDPSLHTPAYVRAHCPFLFTTLLMAGCKFWRPDRFKSCQRLAEEFCLRAFQESWKRVEVVQAFACMTYWKEPDDTRTWTYIGYACRMAVELGMNTFCLSPPADETPLQRLERRNRERTYLVLWVHDRSLSMQTGRQWMLPEDDLVRNSANWWEDSSLLPIDVVISAQVQLRRIAAEVTDVFYLHRGAAGILHADVNYEILLRGCNGKLNAWSNTWNATIKQAGGDTFHFSLLAFFRLHVRLFLNSFGLQSSNMLPNAQAASSVPALAVCYTSAVDTLKLVTKEFANVDMLRYGQDSITVMTAYSAIFLLKLLRTGAELGEGAAAQVHDLIIAAADAYHEAAKGMPSSSSVEYHGRFLSTLVAKARARQERRTTQQNSSVQALHQPQPTHPGEGAEMVHASHAWLFPASPHLPTHPLVSTEAVYDDASGYNNKEVAYWYNIHADLGYGNGVNPMRTNYMNQQQQQQPQQQQYPVYSGQEHAVSAG